MAQMFYTDEKCSQIIISLLKAHGIRRVVASPGTTNIAFVGSITNDPFFEVYSAPDERSGCYIACGLAAETNEPVVISCTGATASRNYLPGLTEAYYRKLPILAVVGTTGIYNANNLRPQFVDRSVVPNDVTTFRADLPPVRCDYDEWVVNLAVNKAILSLNWRGGGPAILNFTNEYTGNFTVKDLPPQRIINRIERDDLFPEFPSGKTAIFIGNHKEMTNELSDSIDAFCATHDAIVLCDLTSGYHGKYAINSSLICGQSGQTSIPEIETLIHLGEVSGDYYTMAIRPKNVWRVSIDGEAKDFFHTLRYVFDMDEELFFRHYSNFEANQDNFLLKCKAEEKEILESIPENIPFSNIWIAKESSNLIPKDSILHLGILNSLRAWNFFAYPSTLRSYCNTGGFGIDGILSTSIGATLGVPNRTCYCIVGDLAFFYDLNSLANRHVNNSLRVMLINNGRGTEFTNFSHIGHSFGKDADKYIAAGGHYGNKSHKLVKHYAEDLGFEYLSADSKKEFLKNAERFFTSEQTSKPMIFEVFTDSKDESDALKIMLNLKPAQNPENGLKSMVKKGVKSILGEKGVEIVKLLKS